MSHFYPRVLRCMSYPANEHLILLVDFMVCDTHTVEILQVQSKLDAAHFLLFDGDSGMEPGT